MKKNSRETLAIANAYGDVDVRGSIQKGYVHVRGQRLQPLCRKLGIKFAPALTEFGGKERYGFHPIFDGVVVSARSVPKLLTAIKEREERTHSPAALARKKKAKVQRERARKKREKARQERCAKLGIDPDGQTAKWLEQGDIDADLAEFIGFKTAYRHEFTDYDEHFSSEQFYALRACGLSPTEARDELREQARDLRQEQPIPATWPEYLDMHEFDSPIAKALAGVLKDPQRCHPIWFKEAEIAVRRQELQLDSLSYELIKRAIEWWRRERETY